MTIIDRYLPENRRSTLDPILSTDKKPSRGHRSLHCPDCRLHEESCICHAKPCLKTQALFKLIMHTQERLKPTNTGRLILECIPETEIYLWSRIEPPSSLIQTANEKQFQPYLIFPDDFTSPDSKIVQFEVNRQKRPLFLILDGTWKQARKIYRKSQYLQQLPHLPLHPSKPSNYQLRRAAAAQHLCTAEVAVELLRWNGEMEAAEKLNRYFELFNDSYLSGRQSRLV